MVPTIRVGTRVCDAIGILVMCICAVGTTYLLSAVPDRPNDGRIQFVGFVLNGQGCMPSNRGDESDLPFKTGLEQFTVIMTTGVASKCFANTPR